MTARLDAAAPGAPPRDGMEELIARIHRGHHVASRILLSRIDVALCGVLQAPSDDRTSEMAFRHAFRRLRSDFMAHMASQEAILFPYLRELAAAAAGAGFTPVQALGESSPLQRALAQPDHDEALLHQIAVLDASCGADPAHVWGDVVLELRKLQADVIEHLRVERDMLLPRAEQLERRVAARARTR